MGKGDPRRQEYTESGDRYLDYCLWDYRPPTPPENKLRSVNLLYRSFELAGMDARANELVDALREAIGPFRTVFGIKLVDGRLGWEFYFYDYRRREREVSMSRVFEALKPFAAVDVPVNENLPYFMFSIDVDADLATGKRDLDLVHMYVGNPGSTVSSGIAYALRRQGTALENFYFFFDGRSQHDEAAGKILCSAHVDPDRVDIDRILRPELKDCRTICVANKQRNDCVYFSEIDVDQLLFFLGQLDYPSEIVRFVEENRTRLDHLLYDVGIDYRVEGDDVVTIKSGYYGVF